MRAILVVALLVSLVCHGAGANGPDGLGPDGLTDTEVTVFLAALQEAVRAENPKQVAVLVKFPLRVGYSSRQNASRCSGCKRSKREGIYSPLP